MSAVAGIYHRDGQPVDKTRCESMLESLDHRGPDGTGVWNSGRVGLGHCMLWTTPESLHEKLPLVHANEGLTLTADARLDNRNELIEDLGLTGTQAEGIADSKLILKAYRQWGQGCPERLRGDFAFAIWDTGKQELFCARDRFGVKPFYYHCSADLFVFASEIKAILAVSESPLRLNDLRVADYLVPTLEDNSSTFYKEIDRLPPAHSLTASRTGVCLRKYWTLDPEREVRCNSDSEYAEEFRELFTQAVRSRLRSAFPVGSTLSGGLDSSSIACLARDLLAEAGATTGLDTFSAVFDEVPDSDERPFIQAVLSQGGFCPHYVRADQISPLADLEVVSWHQDEPFYAPNLFIHWALYRAAQGQNVRVLLDGLDGDTTVSHGLVRLTELAINFRWITLGKEVAGLSKNSKLSPWRILRQRVFSPLFPAPLRKTWHWVRGGHGGTRSRKGIIHPDFARRIKLEERLEALEGKWLRPAHTVRDHHYRLLTSGLFPFVLEVADRASAAFGMEARYPFFDTRLIEFCLAIPSKQKIHHGWTRFVMRGAMAGILPERVRWRGGKGNLSPNFTQALLAFEQQRLEEIIFREPDVISSFVDLKALQEAYNRYVSLGHENDALDVWRAVTLAVWLRGLSDTIRVC